MRLPDRILCFLLVAALLSTCIPGAFAQSRANDFQFTISGTEATLTQYTGSDSVVTVPATYEGKQVVAVAEEAFAGNSTITKVTLPEGLRTIGNKAFYKCENLMQINLPQSLTAIGEMAFCNCYLLQAVVIPKNVQTIGAAAFSNCSRLASFTVSGENPWFQAQDNVLFSKDKTVLIAYLNTNMTAYTVPAQVRVIGERAFYGNTTIRKVTLSQGTQTVEKYAFGSTMLNEVHLSDSVTTVERFAFSDSTDLEKVSLGKGLETVEDYTFKNCGTIGSLILSEGTKTIESNAFSGTDTIGSITVPDSLTQIESGTFSGVTVNSVRYYSKTQQEQIKNQIPAEESVCYCPGEHSYSSANPDQCIRCDYNRDLTIPPTLLSKTHDTVKLSAQPGFEYSYNKTNWRTDGVFTGLMPGTAYSFYCRPVGSTKLSNALQVTTDKGTQSKAPVPQIASRTENTVTLKTVSGCEYSMNGSSWQSSPVFSGLDPEKTYQFYQRFANTATHHAGPASDPVTANPVGAAEVTSTTFTVKDGIIRKIPAGTDVDTLLKGLNGGKYCRVMKGTAQQETTAKVGTGMTVQLLSGGTVKATYTVVVTGDTNGDGQISITDMLAVKGHLLGKTKLSGAAATAADTSGDNNITITDFIQIKAKLLGKGSITAR